MAASVAAAASSSSHAYADAPLSIGYGQTISQPSVVAFMLELMDPRSGDVILDIGSGSGWTTALLAECVKPGGRIVGLEMVPELVTFGPEHIAHACCTACYHSTGTKRVNRPS